MRRSPSTAGGLLSCAAAGGTGVFRVMNGIGSPRQPLPLTVSASLGVGAAWVQVTWVALMRVHDRAERRIVGAHTLDSLFYNPVMLVWEAADLPPGGSGRTALYVYYALLTCLVWHAPVGRRAFRVALFSCGLHAAAVLISTLVYGCGMPIPRLATYYGLADLRAFWRLSKEEPLRIGFYGLCLTVWHAAVGLRLWIAWIRERPTGMIG